MVTYDRAKEFRGLGSSIADYNRYKRKNDDVDQGIEKGTAKRAFERNRQGRECSIV